MKKRNMNRTVILAAACLATGMLSQPLFAEESEAQTEAAVEAPVYDYDELTVGSTTAFDGKFFTEMWGNVSSDIDVRSLIHGYDLVRWDTVEGLFQIDPSVVSGTVVTENEAGDRTYTFTIYDDLAYCDGTPIKAADYAFSMLLNIAPEVKELGGNTRTAEYIVGYDDYMSGKAAELKGLRILGDYTFSITLDHAYLPFFYEQALLDCTPYPISVIAPGCVAVDDGNGICIVNEDEEIEEPLFTAELLAQTILDEENGYLTHPSVTSGPYKLTGYDGETATFEINEYYKGNSEGIKPTIEKLIFKTAVNETMIEELEAAEYGLLNKCVSVDALLKGMKLVSDKDKYFTMGNYPRTGLSFISFCCERDTVKSAAVRQAIAMCLDKDQLVTDYVGNFGLRVDGYYGVGQWMYKAVSGTMPYPVEAPEDEQEKAAYEADLKAWGELSLDNMKVYDLDVEEAVKLLVSDGWVLNREGEEFDPEEDDVRCKEIEGEIVALDLTLLYPEGNRIAESFDENFTGYLKEAGIALTAQELPLQDLLNVYYRQDGERDCDMIYLATNFELKFDPSATFKPSSEEEEPETEAVSEAESEEEAEEIEPDIYNVTGIEDQQLYDLAVAMRRTEPEKVLEYCQEWIAFEERFAEVLPVIPVYSNVYFDFYPKVLHNYNISSHVSWGQAIVEAYLSDVADEPETEAETELELAEGEIEIG